MKPAASRKISLKLHLVPPAAIRSNIIDSFEPGGMLHVFLQNSGVGSKEYSMVHVCLPISRPICSTSDVSMNRRNIHHRLVLLWRFS